MWSKRLERNSDLFKYLASYAKNEDTVRALGSTVVLRDSIAKNTFPKNGYEVLFAPYWSAEANEKFDSLKKEMDSREKVTQDMVKNWCDKNKIMKNAEHFVPINQYVCNALAGLSINGNLDEKMVKKVLFNYLWPACVTTNENDTVNKKYQKKMPDGWKYTDMTARYEDKDVKIKLVKNPFFAYINKKITDGADFKFGKSLITNDDEIAHYFSAPIPTPTELKDMSAYKSGAEYKLSTNDAAAIKKAVETVRDILGNVDPEEDE